MEAKTKTIESFKLHEKDTGSADVQIALLEHCQQARAEGVAMWPTDREEAVRRWADAVIRAGDLCLSEVTDALVVQEEASHLLAFEVIVRTSSRDHVPSLLSRLGDDRLLPEQRARIVGALKAVSGKDFGDDRAAWDAWYRSRR